MLKQISFSIFLLFMFQEIYTQSLEGYWQGAVSRDGSIQITELLIERTPAGYNARYSLPDMGLYEQPAEINNITDSSFSLKIFMGNFECFFHPDISEITGSNNKWKPVGLKLHLKKQTAYKKNFEKLIYEIAVEDGTNIKGTLFKPIGKQKNPLIIIAHGAENPTQKNWVYTSYAYYLAENGFAVYVFDQRGSGLSGGNANATLHHHSNDIISIARFFSKKSFIVQKNITILGESRGGWVAVLASAHSKIFKNIILLAGPAKSPVDLEFDVVQATMEKEGFSEMQIDSALNYTSFYFQTIHDSSLYNQLILKYDSLKKSPWASIIQSPETENLNWWKTNNFDTESLLKKVNANVLAIFGTEDQFVPHQKNASLMQNLLSATKRKHAVHVIQGLPHGIFFYQTLKGNQFSWPKDFWVWPKRSFEMDTLIINFLNQQMQN